jgi:hypothetical protein
MGDHQRHEGPGPPDHIADRSADGMSRLSGATSSRYGADTTTFLIEKTRCPTHACSSRWSGSRAVRHLNGRSALFFARKGSVVLLSGKAKSALRFGGEKVAGLSSVFTQSGEKK